MNWVQLTAPGSFCWAEAHPREEASKQQKNKGLTAHSNSSAGKIIYRWQLAT